MEERFATELLHEVKVQGKRWFIAFCVMVGVQVAEVAGFIWYISLPVEESTTTQSIEDIEDGTITQIGGDSYGEGNSDNNP